MRVERITIEIDGILASTEWGRFGGSPWDDWECDDWATLRKIAECGESCDDHGSFPVIAAGRRVARALGGRVVKEECDPPIPENLFFE